jgi:hypothetical protein
MTRAADKHHLVNIERQLLQALCQETTAGALRETAQRLLVDYRWRDPTHQAVFDSLKDIPSRSPIPIRDQVPARVTRRGFPDVNWDEFFAPSTLSTEYSEDLMRQLRDSVSADV